MALTKVVLMCGCMAANTMWAQDVPGITVVDEQLNEFLNLRDFCVSKDGEEAYFTVQSPDESIAQIAVMHRSPEGWAAPELLSFCDSNRYMEPFLSDNGLRLYFASDRMEPGSKALKNFDIWYVERETRHSPWSLPVNPGKPVNSTYNEFYPTLSRNGNLYYTMDAPSGMGKDDIYCCAWNGKKFAAPQLLDATVNSEGYEFNAFISPDERFLLYTRYKAADGYGSGDLYIARRDEKGNWLPAENLGNTINTDQMEYCPFYDEANQILYFTSRRNTLLPQNFTDLDDFQYYVKGGGNGLSKIYRIQIQLQE